MGKPKSTLETVKDIVQILAGITTIAFTIQQMLKGWEDGEGTSPTSQIIIPHLYWYEQ